MTEEERCGNEMRVPPFTARNRTSADLRPDVLRFPPPKSSPESPDGKDNESSPLSACPYGAHIQNTQLRRKAPGTINFIFEVGNRLSAELPAV